MNTQDPAQSADLSPADERVQPDSPLSGEVKRGGAETYRVEAYCSGWAYKQRDFATLEEAKAYQAELHGMRHYFVPILSGEDAEKSRRYAVAQAEMRS